MARISEAPGSGLSPLCLVLFVLAGCVDSQQSPGTRRASEAVSDSLDATAAPTPWPQTLTVGPNKAVVLSNHLYVAGHTLTFVFEESKQALLMNGELWRSWARPERPEPTTPEETWVQELEGKFLLETGGMDERVEKALAAMDLDLLDPNFEPVLGGGQLEVRFKTHPDVWLIVLRPPPENPEPEVGARKEIDRLRSSLSGPGPYVLINYPNRSYSHFGTNARDVLMVLERASLGMADANDLRTARRLHCLEAVEAIQTRERQ